MNAVQPAVRDEVAPLTTVCSLQNRGPLSDCEEAVSSPGLQGEQPSQAQAVATVPAENRSPAMLFTRCQKPRARDMPNGPRAAAGQHEDTAGNVEKGHRTQNEARHSKGRLREMCTRGRGEAFLQTIPWSFLVFKILPDVTLIFPFSKFLNLECFLSPVSPHLVFPFSPRKGKTSFLTKFVA